MFNKIVNTIALLIALLAIWITLAPLTAKAGVNTSVPAAPVSVDEYTGDLSGLITDACIVDGNPVIISYNNYGESPSQKTIFYQREDGDFAVVYIDRATLGGWYIWAIDKIASGVCPE